MLQIAATQPAHHFIFFSENKLTGSNVQSIITSPAPKTALVWKLWYDYKLPALLKKHKADIFIGPCISSRTKIPQFLFIAEDGASNKKQGKLVKKWLPAFFARATRIITTSEIRRNKIIDQYKIIPEKISSIYPPADPQFQPMNWEEKEAVKKQFSEGKEFFLAPVQLNNHNDLINLLKAFSFFKKRQKSNMQLLIITDAEKNPAVKSLSSYKYRDDVKLLYGLLTPAIAKLAAAAYTFIDVEGNVSVSINALRTHVPLILPDKELMHGFFKDASLYCNFEQVEHTAQQMMLVFKDENKRNELIENARLRSQEFELEVVAGSLCCAITKAD